MDLSTKVTSIDTKELWGSLHQGEYKISFITRKKQNFIGTTPRESRKMYGSDKEVWLLYLSNDQDNNGNYRFVNQLCAYQKYNNIPELFTFLSKLESIEARWFILDKIVISLGMLL